MSGRPERIFTDAERADIIACRRAGVSMEALRARYHLSWKKIKFVLSGIDKVALPKACQSINCERAGQILPASEFLPKLTTYDGLDKVCSRCRERLLFAACLVDRRPASHRDGPPYEYECPVCGMGVDLRGHAFTSAAGALACCIGRGVEVCKAEKCRPGRPREYDRGRATGLLERLLRR